MDCPQCTPDMVFAGLVAFGRSREGANFSQAAGMASRSGGRKEPVRQGQWAGEPACLQINHQDL